MERITIAMLIAVIAVAFAGADVARAEDFTLNVPVKLTNLLPTAKDFQVSCVVKAADNSTIGGTKIVTGAIPADGNLTQTVTVKFNANTGKDPAAATKYECYLYISNGSVVNRPGNCPSTFPECKAKPGTTYVDPVTGNLPQ